MTKLSVLLTVAAFAASCDQEPVHPPPPPACTPVEVLPPICEDPPIAPWCIDCNPCTRDVSCDDTPDDPACCERAGCVAVPFREGEACSVTFQGLGVCVAGVCVEG